MATRFYSESANVGTVKYLVSFHDGVKTHPDGSAFYDIQIFRNQRKKQAFIRGLIAAGYRPRPLADGVRCVICGELVATPGPHDSCPGEVCGDTLQVGSGHHENVICREPAGHTGQHRAQVGRLCWRVWGGRSAEGLR